MSDIALNFSLLDAAVIALILAAPGLIVGGLAGALAWRRHRIAGTLLGAIAGVVVWGVGWFFLRDFI